MKKISKKKEKRKNNTAQWTSFRNIHHLSSGLDAWIEISFKTVCNNGIKFTIQARSSWHVPTFLGVPWGQALGTGPQKWKDEPQKNGGYESQAGRLERKPLSSFTWNALYSTGKDHVDIIYDIDVTGGFILIFYVYCYISSMHICACQHALYQHRSERGIGSSETGVTNSYKQPWMC